MFTDVLMSKAGPKASVFFSVNRIISAAELIPFGELNYLVLSDFKKKASEDCSFLFSL